MRVSTSPNSLITIANARQPRPSRRASPEQVDIAVRLISETAHDLTSPLATLRESVRLVRDGEFGELNPAQHTLLSAALEEAERIEQRVGDMTQLERLRTGLPRVHREWIKTEEIRDCVDQTLRPWVMPRGISLLWDGADVPQQVVYADAQLIQRLIVNLVANAIRATDDGGTVLVKLDPIRSGEAIRWSVIDRGRGMSEPDLEQLAVRGISRSGGEGLGISICRQLAAIHFSNLFIRSRTTSGTEASFETAASGPHSVAQCWSRWRGGVRDPRRRPKSRVATSGDDQATSRSIDEAWDTTLNRVQRSVRLEPPVLSVTLGVDADRPRCEDRLAAGSVTLGAASQKQSAEDFDRLLQNQLRLFELAYRVDARRWVWLLDADARDAQQRIAMIDEAIRRDLPDIRTTWSEPQIIPADEARLSPRISDLLVRMSLNRASTPPSDTNEVRLGTAPIDPSPVPAHRLDDEMRRLTARWRDQSSQLQKQAAKLRPRS